MQIIPEINFCWSKNLIFAKVHFSSIRNFHSFNFCLLTTPIDVGVRVLSLTASLIALIIELNLVKIFLLYGIFGDGHNLYELHWGRVWKQWPMEATITSVKLFLFNILCIRLDIKSVLWSESLLGIILSSSLKCDTSILHIQDMYTNKYLETTTRQMLIYPSHKTVCHCCWI